MAAASVIRRALLYVPASSPKFLTKSLSLTADNVTYDLEDSVAPNSKDEARANLRAHIASLQSRRPASISEIAVRINSVSSRRGEDDLIAVSSLPAVDTIVVPKVGSASDLSFVAEVLRRGEPQRNRAGATDPVKILALIESARGVMNLESIVQETDRLSGLIFAAEDFALDLSLERTPDLTEFLYARSKIVTAATYANLPSAIDLVCTSYKGAPGLAQLEEECIGGKRLGFNGKQCIHPDQVEIVQRLFAPSASELEWATRVSVANKKASAAGRGAWTLEGKMIDAPVIFKAENIISKAQKCGIDVQSLRERWKNEEPQ